jgi:MFS family permease
VSGRPNLGSIATGASTAAAGRESALGPLKGPVFRMLWLTWMAANTTMWMNDVAAAWLMTTLAPSPLWVALVQSASTLPVFILGLPSGALADIVDRKRYFVVTQFWVATVAIILCAVILGGHLTAPLLLALTFANGVGLAMRWPVFAAIIPEIVPRPQLPQALALNGVAMNASRILGPLVAGALIASAGTQYVFVLNATLSIIAGFTIMRWQRVHKESPLGRERLTSAMRVGMQYVWQSSRMRALLLRIALFFIHSTALQALLPLLARGLPGGRAGTFTVLLAAMGAGAIVAALSMPRIRNRLPSTQQRVMIGTAVQSAAAVAVAFAPNIWVAVPAMVFAGAAWITVANSLSVAAQMALPDWVRARGMSIYQMALMGATAAGAALWGQVATWAGIHMALTVSACTSVVLMALAQRIAVDRGTEEDLTPSRGRVPQMAAPARPGRILVNVEYRIDPARTEEFLALMQESRTSRLKQGALDWKLLHDLHEPSRFVEQITDESWTEHLRRFDRVTAADVQIRDRRLSFHVGESAPTVTRFRVEED